jgi:hypothetical protein
MEITLSPETAQRIRSALDTQVDLSPPHVPAALSRLAVEAPAVYSLVLAELSGSQIRLDSERELRRRHRRGLLRRAFFWWGEYRTDVGDRLVAKRRVAAAIPFGISAFILILWAVSGLAGHHPSPAAARAGMAHLTSAPGAYAGLGEGNGLVPPVRRLRPAGASSLPLLDARPVPASSVPPVLHTAVAAPLQNPVVFDRQQAPLLTAPNGLRTERATIPSPVVYVRGASDAGIPLRVASVFGDGHTAANARGGNPQAESPWSAGQRVAARLATGIVVVVAGPPMPVIAESDNPRATWLGRATLGAEGLVQVAFTLTSSSRRGDVHGVALDSGRLIPGLAGRMTLRRPHAAAAVMVAALQAAGDYVQALARQGEAVVADGWTHVTVGQTAPAWTYAASRLAQVLDPSSGAGGQVETAEIAGGSRLTILVTEAP